MSRKANKKTHDIPSFDEINDKMRAELDDDAVSTQYEDSEATEPPYAEYGIMDNNFENLPKSFMETPTDAEIVSPLVPPVLTDHEKENPVVN